MGSGPIVTANDIYHTNNPYPVELPDDLKRVNVDDEGLPAGIEMLPDSEEFFPEGGGLEQLPGEDAPPPVEYNPPAAPVPGASNSTTKVDGRVFFEDTLTPPAPPRTDDSGN